MLLLLLRNGGRVLLEGLSGGFGSGRSDAL